MAAESGTVRFVTCLDEAQARQVWAMFQQEWWSRGRTLEEVGRLLAGPSLLYALVEPATGRVAAFARVVTDGVFKAWLFDVMVERAFRGRGLGDALLHRVVTDPRLAGVAHLELYCAPEMVPFYARHEFSAPCSPLHLLRRDKQKGR